MKKNRFSFFLFFVCFAYYIAIQARKKRVQRNRIKILPRKMIRLPSLCRANYVIVTPSTRKKRSTERTGTLRGECRGEEKCHARRVKRISALGLLRRDVRTEISLLWERELERRDSHG